MVRASCGPRWSAVVGKPFVDFPREMNDMLEQFFGAQKSRGESTWFAPLSLWEQDGSYFIELDLPGVAADAVDITVEKNQLRISAERKTPEGERQYQYQERPFGRVERALVLPESADADSIEAELKDGVLHVKFGKRAEAQPKKVALKAT